MTDPQPPLLPAIPIPAAPLPAVPVAEPYASVAASRPRRMELPSGVDLTRLRGFVLRLSITGAVLGSIVFLILLYLIVYVLPEAAFGWNSVAAPPFDRGFRPFLTIWPAAGALAMAGLVFFYCIRAFSTFRQMTRRRIDELWSPAAAKGGGRRALLPFLRSDLTKIRVVATPLLIIFLIGLATGLGSGRGRDEGIELTPTGALVGLGLLAGTLGACWQLIIVRRARWEVARIEGASFAASQARGFAVLPAAEAIVPPVDTTSGAPADAPPPLAALAPALRMSNGPIALSADVAADLEAADHADAFSDWEALVHGIAILGILLGVLAFSAHFQAIDAISNQILPSKPTPGPRGTLPGPAAPIADSIQLFGALQLLATGISVGWVVWGVICLCGGPRFRPVVLSLIWAGLIISATVFLLSLHWEEPTASPYRGYGGFGFPYHEPSLISFDSIYEIGGNVHHGISPLLSVLVVTVFSLIALLLVTRQAVKSVFAYRPRAGRNRSAM